MTRLTDWPLRFDAFITSRLRMPFAFGSNDCALFAADDVLAITGRDFSAGLRGHKTAREAAKTIRAHGGLFTIAANALGHACPPAEARQGDVVLTLNRGRLLLGVFDGSSILAPGPSGLARMPSTAGVAAWSV